MEDTNPFFRSYHHPPPNIPPYLDPEDLNLEQQAGNHTHGLSGSTDPSPSYHPGPSAHIHNSVSPQVPFVVHDVHNTLVPRSGNTNPHVDQPAQYGRPPPILGTRGSSTFIQTADEYFRFHNLGNSNHSSSVSRVARQAPSAGAPTNHNGPQIERLRLIATIKGVYAALVVVETNLVGEPQVVEESSRIEFLPLITRDGWQWLKDVHGVLLQSYKTFSTTLHGSALVSIGSSGQVFWKSAMKTMIRLLERQESDHLDLSVKEVYHLAYLGIALSGILFRLSKDPKEGLISFILGQWCLQVKNIFGTDSDDNQDWEMAQKEWANWIRFALCNPNLEINRTEFVSGRPFNIGYILRIPELFFRLLPRTINGIGDRFYRGLMRPQSVDLNGSQECPDRVYRSMKGHMLLGSLFAIATTLGFKMELDIIYVMVLENWLKLTCQRDALEVLSRLLDISHEKREWFLSLGSTLGDSDGRCATEGPAKRIRQQSPQSGNRPPNTHRKTKRGTPTQALSENTISGPVFDTSIATPESRHCFYCDVCPQGFTNKANLDRHKAKHLGKGYPCLVTGCGHISNRSDNLTLHMTKVHKKN